MGYRVFVVAGDNEMLRSLSSSATDDFEVSMLQSSNEALWELQQLAPDVLLADYDLPGFSGLDLADLVPNFAPDTRVILLARNSDAGLAAQAEQHGVFRLLQGATSLDEVRVALREALDHVPPPRPEPEPEPEPEPTLDMLEEYPIGEPEAPAPFRHAVSARPEPTQRSGPPQVSKAPQSASKPPQPTASQSVSKAPQPASISKAPQQVSARPAPATRASAPQVSPRPNTAPPPVSARPAPATRASAPQVSPRPTAQQARNTPAPPPAQQPAAAAAQRAPAPPPAEEPIGNKLRKQGGALVLTTESLAPLVAKLKDLGLQLGAQATILTDRWGVPLVEEGRTSLPLPPFLPLLATSFSTMIDYTRQLHNDQGGGLYMHEGDRYDIYIFDVGKQFLLVMIFDKVIAASKLGSVWLYAKRAVRELADELEGE